MSGIVGSLNTRGSGLINTGSATDGQIFTGTGAGLPVGFEAAAAAGGLTLITDTAISSDATIAFTAGFGGAHHHHIFVLSNIIPVDDDNGYEMEFSTDGGSSYASSGYSYAMHRQRDNGYHVMEVSASASKARLAPNTAMGNESDEGCSAYIFLWFPEGTGPTFYHGYLAGQGAGTQPSEVTTMGGHLDSDADVDGVRFSATSGNMTSGSIQHYAYTD